MRIGFIGLGKLGLPCAEMMASSGHDVVGYDLEERRSDSVHVVEQLEEAVRDSRWIFVAVPTPHHEDYGGTTPCGHLPARDFEYAAVQKALLDIAEHIQPGQVVVLISTVLPGTTRKQLACCLPNNELVYNPYLIAMGTVKWDMVNPEMVIIGSCRGGSTPEAEELRKFYASFMENDPRYIVCTWEEAEGVKIFYNTFISAKLAIVNLIQDVAHTLGHMNTDVVTTALAESTQRITSSAYMKAGMGDGGPCHPRDNIALRYLTQRLELGYDLFGSITTARERQAERFAEWLTEYAMPVVILGTSYKPNVTARDGSFALLIGHYVQEKNGLVNYDSEPDSPGPFTYLLGHHGCFHDYPFVEGSVIADPWRECPPVRGCRVEWYGNNNR